MSALQKIRKWRTNPQTGDTVEKAGRRGTVIRRVLSRPKVEDGELTADVLFVSGSDDAVVHRVALPSWSVWCVGAKLTNSADGLHNNPRANKPERKPAASA